MASVMPPNDHMSLLLSCYLDGELTPEELATVVTALESDLDVIAEFRRLQSARRAVRTLPLMDAPPHLLPGGHLAEELSAYLDGELTTMELPAVVSHLETCAECRAELADLDRSRTAVRALPGLEAPAFLDIEREVREDRRRRVTWPVVALGGVAAATLAFAIGFGGSGTEPVSIDVTDLQARHTAVASVPGGAVEASLP